MMLLALLKLSRGETLPCFVQGSVLLQCEQKPVSLNFRWPATQVEMGALSCSFPDSWTMTLLHAHPETGSWCSQVSLLRWDH